MALSYFTSKQHSDPKAIMSYANDAVFKDDSRNNISYQTERVTEAFRDGAIDVDTFMDTLMQELTKLKDENLLRTAAESTSLIKLKGMVAKTADVLLKKANTVFEETCLTPRMRPALPLFVRK